MKNHGIDWERELREQSEEDYEVNLIGGYREDVIADDHYLAGSITREVLQKDRDWRPFLPTDEIQELFGIETSNCTAFGTLNAQEAYFLRKYGIKHNWSDRYLGVRAGTDSNGNSPHKVAETQRMYAGSIPENTFGFTSDLQNIDQYYKGVLWGHKILGVKNLLQWEYQHEWVLNGQDPDWKEKLYDALQFSPLGIAVDAWKKKGGYYVRRRNSDNHWTALVYAVKNKYWLVYDSYKDHLKKLEWDYGFTRAKQYAIIPRKDFSMKFYSRIGKGLIT